MNSPPVITKHPRCFYMGVLVSIGGLLHLHTNTPRCDMCDKFYLCPQGLNKPVVNLPHILRSIIVAAHRLGYLVP